MGECIESKRTLLRQVHPRSWLDAVFVRRGLSLDVHGEVHLVVECCEPDIYLARREGEQEVWVAGYDCDELVGVWWRFLNENRTGLGRI